MIREVNTKFYVFEQNNSGGYFIKNEYVSCFVIIESVTKEDAKAKAEKIFKDYDEYCACCGPRWDTDMEWVDCYDELPKPYELVRKNEAIIYYINGNKARYNLLTQKIHNIQENEVDVDV